MRRAQSLTPNNGVYQLALSDGTALTARTVIIATGASYRRLGIAALEDLHGRGVFYGAATSEAPAMRGRTVVVAGGGNSAGQAALYLAKWASKVTILVRAASLADSMSSYLIRQIAATPNIDVRYHVQLAGGTGAGAGRLPSLILHDTATRTQRTVPADALFVLIGSQPRTEWLGQGIVRDQQGFIITGPGLLARTSPRWPLARPPLPLETSLPGVPAVVGADRRGEQVRPLRPPVLAAREGPGQAGHRCPHAAEPASPRVPDVLAGPPGRRAVLPCEAISDPKVWVALLAGGAHQPADGITAPPGSERASAYIGFAERGRVLMP